MTKKFPLCYQTFGNRHNPCIILIAGIGGQLIDWSPILTQGLADAGYYVVVFDNRDSGLSHHYDELGVPNIETFLAARIKGSPLKPPYTLQDMATDVITLMKELQLKKAHILGGSMGGIIAQYVAINYPEYVLSLICIATSSGESSLPPPLPAVLEYFHATTHVDNQSLDLAIQRKLQLFKIYNHPAYFDEAKVKQQLIVSLERSNHPNGFKRLLLAMICAEPRTEALSKLNVPSLIIHGDYDPVFPVAHAEQLAQSIPGSHLTIFENMGHGLPDYFAKKVVKTIIKFLKS